MSQLINKKMKIVGMHCTSCAMNIDFDLEDLAGVKNAKTSYAKGETEIEFDPTQVSVEQIVDQINKTGYKTQVS